MDILLNRNDFRQLVFERDQNRCVVCKATAVDAHHILERRLFDDGGYYLNNGVSLCSDHHLKAEKTLISCEDLRNYAGITELMIPEHFYTDTKYDKWGNIILPNGTRIKGELFHTEQVQHILKEAFLLQDFTEYVKYPRTYHFPWSPNLQNDDRMMHDLTPFEGKRVIVSLKMDGENANLYPNYIHARSLLWASHPSRTWIKSFWGSMKHDIPEGWRICGENVFAEHSIHYKNLDSYFYAFSIWNERNNCLAWDEFVDVCEMLNLKHVPVLYDGIWDPEKIQALLIDKTSDGNIMEGYVGRIADEISYGSWRRVVGKCVRKDHVQTDEHWLEKPLVKNNLKSNV